LFAWGIVIGTWVLLDQLVALAGTTRVGDIALIGARQWPLKKSASVVIQAFCNACEVNRIAVLSGTKMCLSPVTQLLPSGCELCRGFIKEGWSRIVSREAVIEVVKDARLETKLALGLERLGGEVLALGTGFNHRAAVPFDAVTFNFEPCRVSRKG